MKYYNFKQGSESVFGVALRVDLSAGLEERVADMTGSFRIELIKFEAGTATYEVIRDNRQIAGLTVTRDGNVGLHQRPGGVPVFLSPMTEEAATKLAVEAGYWDLQRALVLEGMYTAPIGTLRR